MPMVENIKDSLKKALLLGGMYQAVSWPFKMLADDELSDFMAFFLFALFVAFTLRIVRKKPPRFLGKFERNFPTLSGYLTAIGWLAYVMYPGGFVLTVIFIGNADLLRQALEAFNWTIAGLLAMSLAVEWKRQNSTRRNDDFFPPDRGAF